MNEPEYEQLTLSAVGFPVNPFLSPGSSEARQMTVSSGRRCCELFGKSGQLGLLEKMLLESSTWHSTMYYLTWKEKVTKGGRILFQLTLREPGTDETESRLWATPNTMDSLTQRSVESLLKMQEKARKGRRRPSNLREQVAPEVMKLWGTPTASDYKGSGQPGTPSHKKLLDKKHLRAQVMQEGTAQLNPDWTEWLMGYPIGWTDI